MNIRFRHSRRLALASAAAVSATVLLASCSGGSSGSDALDLTSTPPTGVTLTLWHNTGDSPALLDLYKAYEKASGNTIDLVDLPSDTFTNAVQTKWSTGDRPDILEYLPTSQDMLQLNMAENMVDLSSMDFVKAEGSLAQSAGSLNGTTYGAVLGPNATYGVFYNKKVLAEAGISAPTNYTELEADCSAISAAGATPVFVGGGSEFPAMMIPGFTYMADFNQNDSYGQAVKNGTTKVNDPSGPLVAGLTVLDTLRSSNCLNGDAATATFDDAVQAVFTGSAAMTVLPSDFITQFYTAGNGDTAAVDSAIGLGAISAQKGIASYSPNAYGSYFVPKTGDTTKERAAADFIQWVTSTGYQSYVDEAKIVPTLSTATAPDLTGLSADMKTLLSSPDATLAFNSSLPGFGNYGKIAVSVLVGQATPQGAADQFQTFVDQAIAAQQ
ncbi:ABC transporter substrate-binding protein [Subtercola sp. YIM 133946]|uniref:ABC transporter substrate-binding protein n=1 Tax=Subtercola sp. YIM 133946 TaxID=3118909 RepID=UPI002F928764